MSCLDQPKLPFTHLSIALGASLSVWLGIPSLAIAGQLEAPANDPLVFNGAAATTCQWPTTVSFKLCSGILVHPEIALIAPECVEVLDPTQVDFGESLGQIQKTVAIDHCMVDPNPASQVAYCKLATPVDVPITPIANGCELDELDAGRPVMLTGFGYDQTQHGGTKRWAEIPLSVTLAANTASFPVGEGDLLPCVGDAGIYAELSDGTWRTVGYLIGAAANCGSKVGEARPSSRAISFIEANSGVDVTPCFDPDGTWNPSAACGGFALDPLASMGLSWDEWCPAPVSGLSSLCGPAYGEPPDVTPPSVSVAVPSDGTVYAEPSVKLDVELDVFDTQSKLRRVSLWIDGNLIVSGIEAPHVVPGLEFPAGEYELSARAEDWSGNIGESESVTLIVGQSEPSDGGEDETEGGETEGGETGATAGETGGGHADGDAHGCRLGPNSPTGVVPWLLALLGLAWIRRDTAKAP